MIVDYLLTFFNRQPDGSMVYTCVEQTQGEFRFPEAPVEPVDELVEILLQILAGEPVERARQVSLELADNSSDVCTPRQQSFSFLFWRCRATIMVLRRAQDTQCRQAVGAERLMGEQALLGKALDLLGAGRRDRFDGDETRLLAPALHRHEDVRLAFRSPATFASGAAPADEGVIHFLEAPQSIDTISISYGLAYFAQHAMGRNPGHPDLHGQPALVADHQIDRQKPTASGTDWWHETACPPPSPRSDGGGARMSDIQSHWPALLLQRKLPRCRTAFAILPDSSLRPS